MIAHFSHKLISQNISQCIQKRDKERAKAWGFPFDYTSPRWKCNAQGMVLIWEALLSTMLRHIHNSSHYERDVT